MGITAPSKFKRRTRKACASAAVKGTAVLQNTTRPTSSAGVLYSGIFRFMSFLPHLLQLTVVRRQDLSIMQLCSRCSVPGSYTCHRSAEGGTPCLNLGPTSSLLREFTSTANIIHHRRIDVRNGSRSRRR